MKLTTSFSLLAVALMGAQSALGFPEYASRSPKDFTVGQIVQERVQRRAAEGTQFPKRLLGLDGLLEPLTGVLSALGLPAAQKQGAVLVPDAAHPYIAPGPNDIRGLCPTMNTMANHGYIARNGITTFAEAANGCQQAYGFSYDLCTFLSALGLLAGGDIVTGKISIGGPDSRVPNTLGKAGGLNRHGVFEIDGSMTRADTFFGNNHNFQIDRWNNIVKMADANGGKFDNTMWKKERKQTYDYARANNPEFYAGVKYLAVSIAERAFIQQALPSFGEHQSDKGIANYRNVAPFFLNETFPTDWIKRGTPYSLLNLAGDVVDYLTDVSTFTPPGQNQGVGNFVPFSVDLPTEVPGAACFLLTTIQDVGAGGLEGDTVHAVAELVEQVIAPLFKSSFNCDFSHLGSSGADANNINSTVVNHVTK